MLLHARAIAFRMPGRYSLPDVRKGTPRLVDSVLIESIQLAFFDQLDHFRAFPRNRGPRHSTRRSGISFAHPHPATAQDPSAQYYVLGDGTCEHSVDSRMTFPLYSKASPGYRESADLKIAHESSKEFCIRGASFSPADFRPLNHRRPRAHSQLVRTQRLSKPVVLDPNRRHRPWNPARRPHPCHPSREINGHPAG